MCNFRGLLHFERLACGSYQPPVQPCWGMEARATVGIRHQYAPVSVAGSGTSMTWHWWSLYCVLQKNHYRWRKNTPNPLASTPWLPGLFWSSFFLLLLSWMLFSLPWFGVPRSVCKKRCWVGELELFFSIFPSAPHWPHCPFCKAEGGGGWEEGRRKGQMVMLTICFWFRRWCPFLKAKCFLKTNGPILSPHFMPSFRDIFFLWHRCGGD